MRVSTFIFALVFLSSTSALAYDSHSSTDRDQYSDAESGILNDGIAPLSPAPTYSNDPVQNEYLDDEFGGGGMLPPSGSTAPVDPRDGDVQRDYRDERPRYNEPAPVEPRAQEDRQRELERTKADSRNHAPSRAEFDDHNAPTNSVLPHPNGAGASLAPQKNKPATSPLVPNPSH